MLRLARTRYAGTNHTHLSELLSEREGIDMSISKVFDPGIVVVQGLRPANCSAKMSLCRLQGIS